MPPTASAGCSGGSGEHPPRNNFLIVESPRDSLLAAFTRAGFYTSCYVDAPKPSRLSADSLHRVLVRLRRVASGGHVRALSCSVWWYPTLRDSVPGIDLLTWAHRSTQSEFLLYPPYRKMLSDPRLKVILLKRKGRYHR